MSSTSDTSGGASRSDAGQKRNRSDAEAGDASASPSKKLSNGLLAILQAVNLLRKMYSAPALDLKQIATACARLDEGRGLLLEPLVRLVRCYKEGSVAQVTGLYKAVMPSDWDKATPAEVEADLQVLRSHVPVDQSGDHIVRLVEAKAAEIEAASAAPQVVAAE